MSWEEAKKRAEIWVREKGLGKSLKGQFVDLATASEALDLAPAFRAMVVRAAARIIKKRGGSCNGGGFKDE